MRNVQVLVDRIGERLAAARMVDGRLDDLIVDPPAGRPRLGAIYRAVVARGLKGQGAAIVELPGAQGFLKGAKGLSEGGELLVQVSAFAEPGKAVPVTHRLLFKSRYAIATPDAPGANISRAIRDPEARARLEGILAGIALPERIGIILRSAAETADDDEITADIAQIVDRTAGVIGEGDRGVALVVDGPGPREIARCEWSDAPEPVAAPQSGAFAAAGVLDAIDRLSAPLEPLEAGASMFIEPTRAFVAVDVNTGRDLSPAAGLKANLAAARALPRALRLRGLGGQVVVDFAPIPKRDRKRLEQGLQAAFRADPVESTLVGWTPLGHFEITRKRERLPLKEADL